MSTVPDEALPADAYRLLVPVFEDLAPDEARDLFETAATIAHGRNGGLVIASIAALPRQTPLDSVSSDDDVLVEARETTEEFVSIAEAFDVPVAGVVRLTRDETPSILDFVAAHDCDGVFMLIDPESSQRRRLLNRDTVERIVSRAECEVFVRKQPAESVPIESVLLAVSGGPHSGLAATVARSISHMTDATIDVVHLVETGATDEERENASRVLDTTADLLDGVTVETALVESENIAEAIIERSNAYDLTVLGAPTMGLLQQFVYGTIPDRINRESPHGVMMAQANTGTASIIDRWLRGDADRDPDPDPIE